MNASHRFRNFILGKNRFIPSHTQYKRVLLTGQLCIVCMVICTAYFIFGFAEGIRTMWAVLIACFAFANVSFMLNRNGHYSAAKILLATSINCAVFVLCLIEPFESGLYTYFIVCGLGVLAVFGYEERGKATFFVGLSTILFLISMMIRFDIIPDTSYTPEYIRINIIINFLGSLIAALLIIFFLINVNHHSEAGLRNNEHQIQQKNQELTKLNTELDRFVYSTSHDLRAPINSIQGLIQLTRMTSDKGLVGDYISIMENRLASLTKFIGDISDYARNSRIDINYQEIDVNKLVAEVLEGLRFYPGAEKIEIIKEIPEEFKILSDPMRLQIILSNLLSNCFKYADLRKENAFLRVTVQRTSSSVRFVIADNGVGIQEQYLPRIFDMFFQATDKSEGSGLGLYIVKEAVGKLAGSITATSQSGHGAEFNVRIPIVRSSTEVVVNADLF